VFASPLKQLLVGTRLDQSRNPARLVEALRTDNAYFGRLVEYCRCIEKEQVELLAAMNATRSESTDA
jgi:hypothetical protein